MEGEDVTDPVPIPKEIEDLSAKHAARSNRTDWRKGIDDVGGDRSGNTDPNNSSPMGDQNAGMSATILGEDDLFGLNMQDDPIHPGKLDLANEDYSDSQIALHLLKGLRWSHKPNNELDLNTIFDCLSTTCMFASRGTNATQHFSGEGKIRFGEATVPIYFEIPFGGRRDVTFTPFEYEVNNTSFRWSVRFGQGHALFGINVSTQNKYRSIIRKYIGID